MLMDLSTPWIQAALSLAVGLGVGLLVGLEREQFQSQIEERRFGGVRTFGLLGLAGALAGLLVDPIGVGGAIGVLVLCGAPVVANAIATTRKETGGFTTEIAALVVLAVGLFSALPLPTIDAAHRWGIAAAVGVTTMALLSMRVPLHQLAQKTSSEDLYATAKLGVLLLMVLPMLPNEGYGPGGQINPFEVGVMVALIAGIGFLGYLAVRSLGARKGMTVTGAVGGLVSSTAVTLNFSARAKEDPGLVRLAAMGIALASTLMFPRQLLAVAVVDPSLVAPATLPLGGMGLVGIVMSAAFYLRFRAEETQEAPTVEHANPFSLEQALRFGLLYVGILLFSDGARRWFGDTGVYVSALVGGLPSIDAVTLSIGRMHRDGMLTDVAVLALVLAAVANTAAKGLIALFIGGWPLGFRVMGIFLPMLITGIALAYFHPA